MTGAQATRWIIIAGIVLGIAATIRALTDDDPGLPSVRQPIAILIVLMLLALIRESAPEIAGAFAVLIVITAALTAGGPVWDALTTITTPQEATP